MMIVIEENCFRIRPLSAHFTSSGRLAATGKGRTPERGEPPRPFIDSHCPPLPPIFPPSFEATRDARCAAARPNQVTVGVEDFKGNCISERVPVNRVDLTPPHGPNSLPGWRVPCCCGRECRTGMSALHSLPCQKKRDPAEPSPSWVVRMCC